MSPIYIWEHSIRTGSAIFLIAVGAVITFAVNYRVNGFNLSRVGVIPMIAGAAGLLLELALYAPRRAKSPVAPPPTVTG